MYRSKGSHLYSYIKVAQLANGIVLQSPGFTLTEGLHRPQPTGMHLTLHMIMYCRQGDNGLVVSSLVYSALDGFRSNIKKSKWFIHLWHK